MGFIDPKYIALKFNECINSQDIKGLVNLMTEDHSFIDISEELHQGRDEMQKGWEEFFNLYPDYQNIFSRVESRDNLVIMLGYSTCSYNPLDGPAIWTAKIKKNLISEWRVYEDTQSNRELLGIE